MFKKRYYWNLSGIVFLLISGVIETNLLVVTPFTFSPLSSLGSNSGILVRDADGDSPKQHPISTLTFRTSKHLSAANMADDENNDKNNDINGEKMDAPNDDTTEEKLVVGWDKLPLEETLEGAEADADDVDALFDDEYCSVLDDFGCEAYEELAKNLDEKVHRWIRIEAKKDETLQDIQTREDVFRQIEKVRSHQEKYGQCSLYTRKWQPSQDTLDHPRINGDGPRPVASFSVLQFNALAEGLSSGPHVKTPFPMDSEGDEGDDKKQKDPGYGGFTKVSFPEVSLDFSLRRWRLLEVILGVSSIESNGAGGTGPTTEGVFDILALEEIDRFRGFFAPLLRTFGYEGIFMPKAKAPGVKLGYYSDGCALFWKTNVFRLVSEDRRNFKLGNQVIILAQLEHLASGCPVVVVVTHLKAQKSETNEKIRTIQVEEALELAQVTANREAQARGLQIETIPVLIMGDFNADPPSEISFPFSSVGRILSNHQLAGDNKDEGENRPLKFESAYPIDPPHEGFFTTWKTRGTATVRRVIDYIFHSASGKMKCAEHLSVPDVDELEESKLPGLRYPSDHLMIGAKFDIFE